MLLQNFQNRITIRNAERGVAPPPPAVLTSVLPTKCCHTAETIRPKIDSPVSQAVARMKWRVGQNDDAPPRCLRGR